MTTRHDPQTVGAVSTETAAAPLDRPLRPDTSTGLVSATRAVDVFDGVTVTCVSVTDFSDQDPAAQAATQHEIAVLDELLRSHPDFAAPAVNEVAGNKVLRPNNPVSAWMYETKPALRVWRTNLVPTAKALTALYNADRWKLPTGERIDAATRNYFIHSLDAIGVRTRAAIMSAIAQRYVQHNRTTRWASLACGAAIPVFQALDSRLSGAVDVKLVDLDAAALAHAAEYATGKGFAAGADFQLLKRHLIREMVATPKLVYELGESTMDFVDMLGIFEYIPEKFNGAKSAASFLHNAFRLVRPGGGLVIANMLDTRPQLAFNQRGIGWPRIFPRSLAELLRIISDAGIAPEQVSVTVPEDGVYAVVEIRKPQA